MKTMTALGALGTAGALLIAGVALAHDGDRATRMFERFDLDGNGAITLQEAVSNAETRFDTADANTDGVLTEDEIKARAEERMAEKDNAERKGEGRHMRRISRMIDRVDANGNGAIERTEAIDAATERFTRLDADGNGSLTMDEISKQRRGHKKG